MYDAVRLLEESRRSWIAPDEAVYVPPLADAPKELREKEGRYVLPGAKTFELEDVSLCGPAGVGFYRNDIVLDTAYAGRLDVLERNAPYLHWAVLARNTPPTCLTLATSLVSVWSSNYFHWNTELLTKLWEIERYTEETGDQPVIIVERNAPQWAIDSLAVLGYYYPLRMPLPHISVGRLVVTTCRRSDGRTSADALSWLRSRVLGNVTGKSHSLIYISRGKARERRIVNEDEVVTFLEGLGFKTYHLENMTFPEQAALFSDADVVVAAHGAGLTNTLYSQYRPHVVELFGEYVNPCFYAMSGSLLNPYSFVLCEPRGSDLYVDTAELGRVLNATNRVG